uniref:Uncharacterized protein n=1 Tax=Rhizophora mucronata TaxID=61149 RepID=A0A2P2QAB4_RHIMU
MSVGLELLAFSVEMY